MTAAEVLGPRFEKRAATTSSSFQTSAVNRLQYAAELEADFLRRGLHKINKGADVSDDIAHEWAKTHPKEALEWGMARVKTAIAEEYVSAAREISDTKLKAQTEIGQWPSDLAMVKKAERQAAHDRLPETIEARRLLKAAYTKRDALLEANPRGEDLTNAQRFARDGLARRIARLEAMTEPRFRSDREIVS